MRIESALYSNYEIPPQYDSMILKLIVHDDTRELALSKLRSALGEVVIEGVKTNLDFQYELINHPEFENGEIDTGFVERILE